jgi:tetratricopeptide (TPR) repeat protein
MDLPPELRPMLKYNAALLPSGRDFNPNMLRIMDGIDQSLHTSPKPNAEKIQPISQRTAALAAYQRGRTQYDERRYDAALTSFTEFLGVFPEDSSAFHYRGMIYMMRKEYHKAIADFTQAIRFRSDDAVLYHNRGGACFYLKDYEGAIANFREALRFQPDDKLAYYRRGTAYLERQRAGDFADAISDFNQAIRLGYKTSEVFERRGLARMHEKDFNGAIQDFSEAIRLKPDEPLYYFQRAEACVRKKDYKGAIANYTEAIRFNARYVEAYNGRGLARLALGKSIELDVSIEDFTQAILYGHDHPMLNTFYNNRGIAWINKNNPKKAIEDHSHAIRLKPADPIAYRLRSEVYQQQGDSALAAKDADEARRLEGLQSE